MSDGQKWQPPAIVPESPLESTDHGLIPKEDGWFVLNAREARWRPGEGRGAYSSFEGDQEFPQLGIHLDLEAYHLALSRSTGRSRAPAR
jgi:hypothetical protein